MGLLLCFGGRATRCFRSQILDLYICYSAATLMLLCSVSSLAQANGFTICAKRTLHRCSALASSLFACVVPLSVCGGCVDGFSLCAWIAPICFRVALAIERSVASPCAADGSSLRAWIAPVLFYVLLGVERSVALPCAAVGCSLCAWIAPVCFCAAWP